MGWRLNLNTSVGYMRYEARDKIWIPRDLWGLQKRLTSVSWRLWVIKQIWSMFHDVAVCYQVSWLKFSVLLASVLPIWFQSKYLMSDWIAYSIGQYSLSNRIPGSCAIPQQFYEDSITDRLSQEIREVHSRYFHRTDDTLFLLCKIYYLFQPIFSGLNHASTK